MGNSVRISMVSTRLLLLCWILEIGFSSGNNFQLQTINGVNEQNLPVNLATNNANTTYPIIAYTDYDYRPTARPHSRPHITESSTGNRYSDFNSSYFRTHMDARSTNLKHDNPIVYPDNLQTTCTYGLCYNVVGYPKEQIQKILTRSHLTNGYFEVSEDAVNIDNRFNTDEMTLCETKVHTIYPEKANNTKKVERVIVNVEGHKQGIVFETCVHNGKCKFSSNFPTGYTSFCKQKYIHKRLMVLGDDEKFVFDAFEVPSCCVCTVTRTD